MSGVADGRRVAYLMLKDFVTQARAPLASAFAAFRAAGASGTGAGPALQRGGLISVADTLASGGGLGAPRAVVHRAGLQPETGSGQRQLLAGGHYTRVFAGW